MKFVATQHFIKAYERLPADIRAHVDKQISLLLKNPKHPSLRSKKIQSTKGEIFEGRIGKHYRFTFHVEKDTHVLRTVGPHNQTLKRP